MKYLQENYGFGEDFEKPYEKNSKIKKGIDKINKGENINQMGLDCDQMSEKTEENNKDQENELNIPSSDNPYGRKL